MQDFHQWLEAMFKMQEKGARTRLGPYPDGYGAAQYPPAYDMPRSSTALWQLKTWHPKVLDNTNPPPKKKHKKKKKS